MLPLRTNPQSVMPEALARSIARELAAETLATICRPAAAAFCTTSKEARPLTTSSTASLPGMRPAMSSAPTALSMALWRPMSSYATSTFPLASQSAAAWMPPVRAKLGCSARRLSTAAAMV